LALDRLVSNQIIVAGGRALPAALCQNISCSGRGIFCDRAALVV
jgi:hypothetical protein